MIGTLLQRSSTTEVMFDEITLSRSSLILSAKAALHVLVMVLMSNPLSRLLDDVTTLQVELRGATPTTSSTARL